MDIVSTVGGAALWCDTGHELAVDLGNNTTSSALYDAVLVPVELNQPSSSYKTDRWFIS